MNTVWLIARREFRVRTLSKASLISSGIMIAIIVIGSLIAKPFLAGDDEPGVVQVDTATAGELVPYLDAAAEAQDAPYVFEEVEAPAEPAIAEDTVGLVVGPADAPTLYLDGGDETLTGVVQAATQQFALTATVEDLGGDPGKVATALAGAVASVEMLGDDAGEFDSGAFFAGFAVIFILFFVLIQSSSVIMMGVVEEKSSRVVEILLATVRPATLLGGKVLGVGLYALVQAAAMVVPAVFATWYLGLLEQFEIPLGPLLSNLAVWFVLGFAIFTVFFGGLAALVSRQEDIGAVSTPMMLLMMVPLYLSIYLVPNNPDGAATAVLTQVPFFAPFMVPMRAAFGTIAGWEIALAIGICLATIPLLTWIAGRVYAGAVLNTGGRMKFRDALARG
ncbi:ABC transporter permease [Demequina sp. NBRC 110055]|uniref:ABC transporter permease n=1 Tax=Demequina sp. NBRC 110055 TaxID=1570344 RepID=UPI000A01C7B7|nr:ABC transporter permease [Demequina sp. NBRC 110055]